MTRSSTAFQPGDWVVNLWGWRGRVTRTEGDFFDLARSSDHFVSMTPGQWLAQQLVPPKMPELLEPWYHVECVPEGSYIAPQSHLRVAAP